MRIPKRHIFTPEQINKLLPDEVLAFGRDLAIGCHHFARMLLEYEATLYH